MCHVKRGGILSLIIIVFFLVVIKDNNILELQRLLKHNVFANRPTKTFNHVMLIYATNKFLLNKRGEN
jgi:hypothetical protein